MDTLRFCFLNTYLLRVPLPLWPGRHLHAVPAVTARAAEIGTWLSGRHDVVALCEAFEPADQAVLADAWKPGGRRTVVAGPGPRRPQAGSGLLTVSAGPPVVRQASHVFAERGRRLFDSDAWADKGVLWVELDLGPDRPGLEVVSTHLLAGDDLPPPHHHVHGQLALRRRRQVEEVLDFFDQHHRPGNAVVVAGDFNIEATSRTGAWLVDRFADRGFVDAGAEAGPTNQDGRIDYAFVRGADVVAAEALTAERHAGAPERDALATVSDHAALHLELDLAAGALS